MNNYSLISLIFAIVLIASYLSMQQGFVLLQGDKVDCKKDSTSFTLVHGFPEQHDEGMEAKLKASIILHHPEKRRKKETIFAELR